MFVIEVIPLSRATTIESLSYYSAKQYPNGSIISVPVRKQFVQAIVVGTQPVSAAKTALRAAMFSLRKLSEQDNIPSLPASIMQTAETLCTTVPSHVGSILFSLLPADIRSGVRPYPQTSHYVNTEDSTPRLLSSFRADRFITYKSLIRQSFAHRGSVLFIVPTSAAVAHAKASLEQGIEKRVVCFASTYGKRQLTNSYELFSDLSTAKLIIATPNFAFLDRHDITTIILEEAGSGHYKSRTRPYLDVREVCTVYAKITKRALIFGDTLLRTEEEILRREERYTTFDEHTKRLSFGSTFTIAQHNAYTPETEFSVFTDELTDAIKRTLDNKGRVFLFAARKGLAPLVACYDCGHIFRCPDSGAPYSLLQTGEGEAMKRWFISTTSGKKVPAADVCPACNSWRLREQGVGIQQVHQQAQKLFPKTRIVLFDHTTAATDSKARLLMEQFYETKGAILIGTAMALPYMTAPVSLTAVTSYEATRAIPTWRAEETLLSLLFTLRENATHECIVQTRTETDQLLKYAARGLADEFYAEEIQMREALSYPPYSYFILLTWTGTDAQVKATEAIIKNQVTLAPVQCYNNPLITKHGITRHGLLRIKRADWPIPKLMDQLRSLPPTIKIEVSPDRII